MKKLTLKKILISAGFVVAMGIFFRIFTYPGIRQMNMLVSIPNYLRTDVYTIFIPAHPGSNRKAKILYTVPADQWDYDQAQFKTRISGELTKVCCLLDLGDPIIFDPSSEDWKTWLERLEGVRKQAETGLTSEGEEFLRREILKEQEAK